MSARDKASAQSEYGRVRAEIDVDALNAFLITNAPEIATPVTVKQFSFGQSNPTYCLIDRKNTRFVMRKKPAGTLLSSNAHDVSREHQILSALHTFNARPSTSPSRQIPVPRPIALCVDSSVLGTPFYIMEYLEGRIFTDPKLLELPPADRRACWLSAVQMLGRLASINPDDIGLSSFGPRTAFFPRQLRSIAKLATYQAKTIDSATGSAIGTLPFLEQSLAWYQSHLPDESTSNLCIVHGDYKMDNLVFHPTEPYVIGILDWELSTLGNQLSDLGHLVAPFSYGPAYSTKGFLSTGFVGVPQADIPISLEEVEREYRLAASHSLSASDFLFVRSWMVFRMAVGIQGIAARVARGQASSANASEFAEAFPIWATIAKSVRDGIADSAKSKL